MNFSSRSIISAFLVIIVLALGYFVVLPRWTAYTEARAVFSVEKEKKSSLENAQEQLEVFLLDYRNHSREASTLNTALPLNRSELYNILNSLDTITKESGITLAGLNTSDSLDTDTLGAESFAIQPVDVQISGSGTYAAFQQLLNRLESNLRIIDVKGVTLHNEEGSTSSYSMKFRTYFQR